MNFSYFEWNKPEILARKGELLDAHLCLDKESAERRAIYERGKGRSARIFERGVKVDGIEILLHVVIVRRKARAVAA